ncbi:putative NRPS-like enzyme [Ophiobolus disseminans]|uniref:Putative NRPS-like enzyme n=1 Tax=Ophiobolus disseminans TaxID=1469910 RepID=A0A6A7AHM3_9PLEO|nr:putative NRPS-like enzyme [Ophiobolus disseminans]
MSATAQPPSPSFGRRTLPQTLNDLANLPQDRLYASIPKHRLDLSSGFMDVSCRDMARCVDYMAHWISRHVGVSTDFATLAYIGMPDLRCVAVFLGAVKCGYKVLLPSPRNPPSTNLSLMQQTNCTTVLYVSEVLPVVKALLASSPELRILEIPSLQEMLDSQPPIYTFEKDFADAQDDPIVILHSSGSTAGIPKPITMTHATFAVLDNERNLPTVPGRRNRDYSIWDFSGGGRFYTVFPYFHLAGFLSLLVNPIFTESSSPVLGPALMPPSGELLKEVMRHQKLRALYLPPSIAEQLLMEPGGLEFFRDLDFLSYTGGPFSPSAGELLSTVTELCPLYGSTEAFQVPQLAPSPEDWAWMEWNPCFKLEMQLSDDQPNIFELVLFADESTRNMSALNHNMPGVTQYRTKDLFKQHPQKPGLWQFYGRRDDIIVLSNGEKFNPIPMELEVQSHSSLSGAMVVGQGRSRATLLVEPKPDNPDENRKDLESVIWPHVEEANRLLPAQGRILRSNIIVAKPDKPFARAGKGTIVRRLTENLYESEIEAVYAEGPAKVSAKGRMQPTMVPHFSKDTIVAFVRSILTDSYPDFANIEDDDDLFSHGLDSVMISVLLNNLKAGLGESSPNSDFEWLDTRTVYHNSSLSRLTDVLFHYLNSGNHPGFGVTQSRTGAMKDLIFKYTQGIPALSTTVNESKGPYTVALVGSTGYLGPQILRSLMADRNVASIYCLNRSVDARERTTQELKKFGDDTTLKFDRVKFLLVDIGMPQLGLSTHDFAKLSQEVNTTVYNAWRPDLSLPLSSFEKPFFSGLRTIIDWSCTNPQRSRIVFISSIAAVGEWSKVFPHEPITPEAQIADTNVAMHMGYGESKCVAERVLQVAHEQCGIPVSIVRTGQIGGSSTGHMPEQGWLLALCRTSKVLGVLPTHVAAVDWLPVDVLAQQISDVAAANESHDKYCVYNLVHREAQPWSLFLDTLSDRFGFGVERIGLPEWLYRLEERAREDAEGKYKLEALQLADFLRSLGEGREDMRCVCENIKGVSKVEVGPLSVELLEQWVRGWNL